MRYLLRLIFVTVLAFGPALSPPVIAQSSQPCEPLPVMGVWVWSVDDLLGDNYTETLDELASHYPFDLIVTFLRFPNHELTAPEVHKRVNEMALYLKDKGVGFAPDLDIRNARRSFMKAYPDELQQMLRIKRVEAGTRRVCMEPLLLNDHYSGGDIVAHKAVSSALARVYAYECADGQVVPHTVNDITARCSALSATADSIIVSLPTDVGSATDVSVMVTFDHLYPDVFSPHILSYQHDLVAMFGDIPLAGVCKDEWGFPPYFPRYYRTGCTDYWYSAHYANAYREDTGRDLLADCLLMAMPHQGQETERLACINDYMRLNRERNTEIEDAFYQAVKETFGPDAYVTVHSTWWPFPDRNEMKKNGLDWWSARRDLAQTDEVAPFAVRTALCKKWGSPVWYNMYYKETDLKEQIWSSALAGGRINYLRYYMLDTDELLEAERKVHLLNAVSRSAVDCPVAVIFGHNGAMNWATDRWEDVGMALVDSLWRAGVPTDLIPTSEITNGSLTISSDGAVTYGAQQYQAAVLYRPDLEDEEVFRFFAQANPAQTALLSVGDWTRDSHGQPVRRTEALPPTMEQVADVETAFARCLQVLDAKDVERRSYDWGWLDNTHFQLRDFPHASVMPMHRGDVRLIDGTRIRIAAVETTTGDVIDGLTDGQNAVEADARGVLAVKFDRQGQLLAFAAGELRHLKAGDIDIALQEPVNVAMRRENDRSAWTGFIQQPEGSEIPAALRQLTDHWIYMK